jgi:TrmH family RNA methyltransferase
MKREKVKKMLTIILIGTEHAHNLGAVCRVMANFGFKDLLLINPKCSKDDIDALIRAKHEAAPILKNAKIETEKALETFDYLIATTARTGTDYNIPRSPITPEELAQHIDENNLIKDTKVRVGLVFGREGHGLFNEEIEKCDFVATIPAHHSYFTLNLSHAVSIFLYEITKKLGTQKMTEKFKKATAEDKRIIMQFLDQILEKKDFKSESKRETQRKVWRRMIGKATLTKREAFALIGFLKKML